jgi:ribonuclease R
MEEQILRLLGRRDYVPANLPELLRLMRWPPNRQQELQNVLRGLEQSGRIARMKGNRYIQSREADLVPGRIRINRQGKGFLQPDDPGLKEIMIPEDATSTALHEDRVLVRREIKARGLRPGHIEQETGAVIRILERKRTQIVGTLQRGRQFLYVIPDDPRMPHDIYVPPARDVGRPANVGDKVVVELQEWESRHTNPEGEIIEVLGPPDAEGVDMLSVLRQYQLPLHFPKNVLQEARAVGTTVTPEELEGCEHRHQAVDKVQPPVAADVSQRQHLERGDLTGSGRVPLKRLAPTNVGGYAGGRVDCRRHQVVTIDPDDAKDFDDAICLQRVHDQWKLWVHIADVSHYVKPGSALDAEARKRGNSTYLVDRVIPMLPEALSNELCSLKPNVDRLTKCVEFLLSNEGRVLSTRFYSAVIHSQRRFTYKEVLEILQRQPRASEKVLQTVAADVRRRALFQQKSAPTDVGGYAGSGPEREPNDSIERMLHEAHELAQKIRGARFKAGSLDLDFPEMKIRLDERGRIARIERVENDVSHQLIEEYMLLANEAVAARMMSQNARAIYRVHEPPDERRLQEYREEVLSHHVPCGNLTKRAEVQKLLHTLGTIAIGAALKIGFLRSLMRARYAVEPLGHYGLAKTKYTHFTSPIRRYADLVVHRALFQKSHGPAQSRAGVPPAPDAKIEHSGAGVPPALLYSRHALEETAEHISATERNSADAERDSKDAKLYAFLKAQLQSARPALYPALVIDVRNFGFFVDVPGLAMSGLVHLSSLEDDFYVFNAQSSQLVGRRNRRVIRLGDKVQVQVAKVDSFKKQVDFRLARDGRIETARPARGRDPDQGRRWTPDSRPRRGRRRK